MPRLKEVFTVFMRGEVYRNEEVFEGLWNKVLEGLLRQRSLVLCGNMYQLTTYISFVFSFVLGFSLLNPLF